MDLTLCLTHDCNLRCGYCYAGRKFKKTMPWKTARRAVDFAVEHTLAKPPRPNSDTRRIQFGFFGGEPTLEWDTLRRATDYVEEACSRHGIALDKTLTTNATLLTERRMHWLLDRGFFIGLSIDGNRAMHDALRRFRNGRSSHGRCVDVIRMFRDKWQWAEVIVVVDPRNVAHLGESVTWLVSEHVDNISLNPNFYLEWAPEPLDVWRRGYEAAGNVYIETFREPRYLKINFIDGKIRTRLKEGYGLCDKCNFGEDELAVAASGNIYPCERIVADDTNRELRIGNVFTGFLEPRRSRIIDRRGNTNPECTTCNLRDRCMNWCSCINYATTGAIDRVDGVVCYHEKMTIEIADRVAATLYAESNPYFLAKFYETN